MLVAVLFCIGSPYVPISVLMNLIGAVFAYYFIYLVPAMIQYRTLFTPKPALYESMIEEGSTENEESVQGDAERVSRGKARLILGVYVVLNVVGVAIGAYGLYSVVHQIIDLI